MKQFWKAIAASALLVLCGCLQTSTIIKVKRDGSGTVLQRVLIKKEIAMMMSAFSSQMEGGGAKKKSGLFDEKELRSKAATMGEGVKYVSGKKISSKTGDGYEVVYSFKDISKLSVEESPDVQTTIGSGQQQDSSQQKKKLTFEFTKGSPAALVIHQPPTEKGKSAEKDSAKKQNVDDNLLMAKTVLKDMKISTVIEVQGSVVESDASFQDRSTVTLINVDFEKLLGDETLLRKAMEYQEIPENEANELMKKYPGLKLERRKTVTVRFR